MKDSIIHPTSERLQAFVDNTLDGGDRAVLESHLVGCTSCQKEVEEWRFLFSVLATMPQFAPAPKFADRVMAHITLPDPWYVRAAARARNQIKVFVPKTTRGWAVATACIGLPMVIFGALAAWVLSKPYITWQSVLAFVMNRTESAIDSVMQGTLVNVMQSDVALFFARGLETVTGAGAGAAGALALTVGAMTVLSVWFLYQNLFRTSTTRDKHTYASYSF